MQKQIVATMVAGVLALSGAAWAQDSTEAGSNSATAGSSLALEGSRAAADGNLVGGSVAVPLGSASAAAGSASVGAGLVADAIVAPIDAAFGDDPLPLTGVTVTAQPAPNVPHATPETNQ